MKINLNSYTSCIPSIKVIVERNKDSYPPDYIVCLISATSHVPIIVIAHLYGAMYSYTKELNELIERQMILYKYEEITGLTDEFKNLQTKK